MLRPHAALVETLVEWFDDVAGVGRAEPVGSHVVVVPSEPGFGMDTVYQEFYRALATRQSNKFWSSEIGPSSLAPEINDPQAVPEFVWIGIKAGPAGYAIGQLAEQMKHLTEAISMPSSTADRVGMNTRRTLAGAVSPVSGVLALIAGSAAGPLGLISTASGVLGWGVDVIAQARRNREGLLAAMRRSSDGVIDAARRLRQLSEAHGVPVIIVLDDMHEADWTAAALVSAAEDERGRVLVVASGDIGEGPGISGPVGQWLRSPSDVFDDRPDSVVNERPPSISTALIVGELERLLPDSGHSELAALAMDIRSLASLAEAAARSRPDDPASLEKFRAIATFSPVPPRLSGTQLLAWRVGSTLGGVLPGSVLDKLEIDRSSVNELCNEGSAFKVAEGLWQLSSPQAATPDDLGVWEAIIDVLTNRAQKLPPYEARQLARLVIPEIASGRLPRSNQLSEAIFELATQAADVDDYLTAFELGQGAAGTIRQGGRPKQVWRVALETWSHQLTPIPIPSLPKGRDGSVIARLIKNLAYLATLESHSHPKRTVNIMRLTDTSLDEGSGLIEPELLEELRLEFVERLVEHGQHVAAHEQLLRVRINTVRADEITAELKSGTLGLKRSIKRLQSQLPELEKALGRNMTRASLQLADVYDRLGEANVQLGQSRLALGQFERCLEIRLKWLGPDHADTLYARGYVAVATGSAGDKRGALELFTQLLPDYLRTQGPDHPGTLSARSNIAGWTAELGESRQAVELYTALLADEQRVLGPDHIATLKTRGSIARWKGEIGDRTEALELLNELLPDQERVLGLNHPVVQITRANIAAFLAPSIAARINGVGDVAPALEALTELLPEQQRTLGSDHPDTLGTRRNIAAYKLENGEEEEAMRLFTGLLPVHRQVLGPDHPDTLGLRLHIAALARSLGDNKHAQKLFTDLLPDQQRVLGPNAPQTLSTQIHMSQLKEVDSEPGDEAQSVG